MNFFIDKTFWMPYINENIQVKVIKNRNFLKDIYE